MGATSVESLGAAATGAVSGDPMEPRSAPASAGAAPPPPEPPAPLEPPEPPEDELASGGTCVLPPLPPVPDGLPPVPSSSGSVLLIGPERPRWGACSQLAEATPRTSSAHTRSLDAGTRSMLNPPQLGATLRVCQRHQTRSPQLRGPRSAPAGHEHSFGRALAVKKWLACGAVIRLSRL